MKRTVVLNVVGLTRRLIGDDTPFLSRLAARSKVAAIGHLWPAVTCSVQATYLTGKKEDADAVGVKLVVFDTTSGLKPVYERDFATENEVHLLVGVWPSA